MAKELGVYNVNEMLENMSSSQLLEWIDFYREQPFGYEMENFRFGLIASMILNVNRKDESSKIWEPEEFFRKANEKQSVEEQISILDAYFR